MSLLQRTWFVLSYLARYLCPNCPMDTHLPNITYKRILIEIQCIYNKRAIHFSQIGVQPGRFACSQEVALRRTQVLLPLHLPLPSGQYWYVLDILLSYKKILSLKIFLPMHCNLSLPHGMTMLILSPCASLEWLHSYWILQDLFCVDMIHEITLF